MIHKALHLAIHQTEDEDIRSIRELMLFGLKGLAAYLSHAEKLSYKNEALFSAAHEFMASLVNDELTLEQYVPMTLALGEVGVQAMALLDEANTMTFGNPEISTVEIGVGTRPGILITGHDLHDLKQLLEQTKDQGIDIYTHSEMLPAHYYPELKKYEHLKGNYGNAWHLQTKEFETFNGPIVFTTNCLVPPRSNSTYMDRVYTTGNTGYPGFKVIPVLEDGTKDFTAIDISNAILKKVNNNLRDLQDIPLHEFKEIQGIGKVKAIQLKAICELTKRISRPINDAKIQIKNTDDIAKILIEELKYEKREIVKLVLLNTKNIIVKIIDISFGGTSSAFVEPKDILLEAIKVGAPKIIIAHNHPSGDPTPSLADFEITNRIEKAGQIMGIELLDHIVIGDCNYISIFSKRGVNNV